MEEIVNSFYSNSTQGIFLFDKKFNLISSNPSALKITGLTKTKIKELNFAGLSTYLNIPSSSLRSIKSNILNLKTPESLKTKILRKNKQVLLYINLALNIKSKKFDGFAIFIQEVETFPADEKLNPEKLINYFNDLSQTIIYILKVEGKSLIPIWVSKNITRLLGYSLNEVLTENWWKDHIYKDDKKKILSELNLLFKIGYHIHIYRFVKNDGTIVWFLDELKLIENNKGKVISAIGAWTDITKIKESELSLQKSEEKYRSLFNDAQDMIHIVNTDGVIIDVNEYELKTLGYKKDEFIGMHLLDIVHPDYKEKIKNNIKKLLKGIPVKGNRIVLLSKNKEKIYIDVNISPQIKNGKTVSFRSIFRNITEKLKADNKLKESEEKFRTAFTTNPDSITISRLYDGMFIDVNKGFEKMTGYNRNEVIGKRSLEINIFLKPGDRAIIVEELKAKGIVENFQTKFVKKNGDIVDGLMSAAIITIDNIPHIISITKDISVIKKYEEQLIISENKFRSLVEESPIPIAIVGSDDKGEYLNKKFIELFGYTLKDIPRMADWFNKVYTEENYRNKRKQNWEILYKGNKLKQKVITTNEGWVICKSGVKKCINYISIFQNNKIIVFFIDITKSKDYENEIKRSEKIYKEMSEMLINLQDKEKIDIARELHDSVSQGLSTIKLNITFLLQKLQSNNISIPKNIKKQSEQIIPYIDHLIKCVRDLSFDLRSTLLTDFGLIPALDDYLKNIQNKKGIKCELNTSLEKLDFDESVSLHIYKICQEAVTNVIRHANADRLIIKISKRNKRVIVSIKDNGIGMAKNSFSDIRSLGLLGMKERANIIRGKLSIVNNKPKGVEVKLSIPYLER